MTSVETPASLGYRMPAEWEPHAATWLSWPHNLESWPGNFGPIPGVWAELVRMLAPHEHVHVMAGVPDTLAQARSMVGDVANVTVHDIATNDAWGAIMGRCSWPGPPALSR